jgi:hypothetical protein
MSSWGYDNRLCWLRSGVANSFNHYSDNHVSQYHHSNCHCLSALAGFRVRCLEYHDIQRICARRDRNCCCAALCLVKWNLEQCHYFCCSGHDRTCSCSICIGYSSWAIQEPDYGGIHGNRWQDQYLVCCCSCWLDGFDLV